MKITPTFVIPCDYSLVDQAGKMSVIGIFEKIFLQDTGSTILDFYIAAKFIVNESTGESLPARFEILNENNEVVGDPVILEDASAPVGSKLQVAVKFSSMEFKDVGDYYVRMIHGTDELFKGKVFAVTPR